MADSHDWVKYSCGCIGLRPQPDGFALLITTCDGDHDVMFFYRDMRESHMGADSRPFKPLGQERADELVKEHQRCLNGGRRFFDLQSLIRTNVI